MTETASVRANSLIQKKKLPLPDAIIQATANVTGRLLVTRNLRDFIGPNVRIPYMVETTLRAVKGSALFTPDTPMNAVLTYVAFPPM